MIREEVEQFLQTAMQTLTKEALGGDFDIQTIPLEHPENTSYGDFSTSIALSIGKQLQKNALEIALALREHFQAEKPPFIEKIEVAGPGFINFFLAKEYLVNEMFQILEAGETYGSGVVSKKVLIDYSSPNIAKPFGIGHLRSTIIGQAIYNIYKFLGWETIGDNHVGDWGTQFGALIYQVRKDLLSQKPEKEKKKILQQVTVADLEHLYVKFHKKAAQDPKLEDEARYWFKELEEGDKEARMIWEHARKVSMKEFQRIYKLLGVTIDVTLGESFYEPLLKDIIKEALEKNVAKPSRGALIIEFPDGTLSPAILLKSDEATSYFTRDLATIKYRLERWNPDLFVYETGREQSLHFQQLFFAAELLGWASREKFVHVGHGLYRTKEGKFSTRKGNTIHLEDVLEEAIERARMIIEESATARGLAPRTKDRVAKAVGVGAVKYNDLAQDPKKDIIFDWKKILNLKGNSGPYVQYTYARCKSIVRKAGISKSQFPMFKQILNSKLNTLRLSKEELDLLRIVYKFPEVVREAAEKFAPHLICNFAFELAQKYNLFYDTYPVLKAETREAKRFRLLLTAAVAQLLKNSLSLLGIKALERM